MPLVVVMMAATRGSTRGIAGWLRSSLLQWTGLVLLGLLTAWLTGRLQPHLVPDSPSYLEYPFGSAEAMARSIRTPGYPLWLVLINSTLGVAFVPAAQVVLHATSVFWLCRELRRWQLPTAQVLAVGLAVAIGCTPTDHIATIASDAPAASFGVMLVTAVMRWVRRRWPFDSVRDQQQAASSEAVPSQWSGVPPVVCLALAAIMLRPAYLFVLPWLVLVVPLLARLRGADWLPAVASSFLAALPVLLCLLGWMGFRHAAVGDFGLVPFGHQNMAGVLVQLLSDEELLVLGDDSAPLALAIVVEKQSWLASGNTFADGAAGATMTIENRWDDMTYRVVVPASKRVAGDDPVAQHGVLAELNQDILARYPLRYIFWIAKGLRRGAWGIAADIVMHPVFLLAIGGAWLAVVIGVVGTARRRWTFSPSIALRSLTVIAATYLVFKLGFVVLSSPPIGRFSDAAAIFLPGWLAACYLNLWRRDEAESPRPEVELGANGSSLSSTDTAI